MNKCFWNKVWNWVWGGASEFVTILFCVSLFCATIVGIAYALTCPLPDASPVISGVVFLLRLLFGFLMLVCFIKNCVYEVGAKLRQFKKECE